MLMYRIRKKKQSIRTNQLPATLVYAAYTNPGEVDIGRTIERIVSVDEGSLPCAATWSLAHLEFAPGFPVAQYHTISPPPLATRVHCSEYPVVVA